MVDQYDSWLVGQGNNNQSGDLNELKHQVKAAPGELGGAPAAGGYVIDVTESTFQATVTTSATFPILLLLWTANDDRLFDMARTLGDAVNKLNGQIQLARIDVKENPQIAQAFRVTAVPALFALVNGQPMMVTQPGVPTDDELTQITDAVLPQIIQLAQQQGVTGTAPYSGDPEADRKAAEEQAEQIPPEHEEAHRLALSGDYSGAAAAYEKVLEANPNDALAARERSKALLLARSATADVREVRAAAAAHPDNVDAQLAVADIDMIGGQIQDAFDRLLDWLAAGHKDELEPVRKRLLEYFAIPEPTDERLKRARRRLATLMF